MSKQRRCGVPQLQHSNEGDIVIDKYNQWYTSITPHWAWHSLYTPPLLPPCYNPHFIHWHYETQKKYACNAQVCNTLVTSLEGHSFGLSYLIKTVSTHTLFIVIDPFAQLSISVDELIEASANAMHFIIVVGAHSEVTLTPSQKEHRNDTIARGWTIIAHAGAIVKAYEAYKNLAHVYMHYECVLYERSSIEWHLSSYGLHHSLTSVLIRMQEPYAQCVFKARYQIHFCQHASLQVHQRHSAPFTTTLTECKTVAHSHASMQYQGTIEVDKAAYSSTASQSHYTLLTGEKAHIRSEPTLQVHTNDIQCKHASAVGGYDPEVIYYLQARGISLAEGQSLLIESFLQ